MLVSPLVFVAVNLSVFLSSDSLLPSEGKAEFWTDEEKPKARIPVGAKIV